MEKRCKRAEEEMFSNKMKAQTVEVVAKETKEELKIVQVTLKQTTEELKTTVQETVKLKAVVDE
jgi:reticulocyte-binding protein